MREIKFRAWDKDNAVMVSAGKYDDEYISFEGRAVDIDMFSSGIHTLNYDLMQYTGLKDKNGFEIYEGDIIALDGLIKGNRKVYWHDNFACWAVTKFGDTLHLFHDDCEVIGNIYENPNLIKSRFYKEWRI